MARFDDAYTPSVIPVVDEQTKLAAMRNIAATTTAPTSSEQRKAAYYAAQAESKGTKPEAPPADANFTYQYVWRQDVGAPTGKWSLIRIPIVGATPTGTSGPVSTFPVPGSAGTTTASTATTAADAEAKRIAGQSAYDLLFSQFQQYGLGALVEPLKGFITEGLSPAEFTLRLRETPAYKSRFAANAARIGKGLSALSEAEYIGLEDQYQNIMRQYGLPEAYYTRGDMGRQQGFEKFISSDVSPAELEDRIQTAQNRVLYAAPEVSQSLREFYPDITNGDILAYALDPEQALTNIKRKVTAAEIGAGARQAGLGAGVARAEELARYGVTGAQAREGFQAVASVLPRAGILADIYAKQEVGPYTQTTAEQEVFGLAGAAEAQRKRQKLTQLEQAQFAGSSGAAGGALARERAGSF